MILIIVVVIQLVKIKFIIKKPKNNLHFPMQGNKCGIKIGVPCALVRCDAIWAAERIQLATFGKPLQTL